MSTINATNLRKKLFKTLDTTIKYNETVTVNTKNGNAIILSEDEYNGLIETIYLTSLPNLYEGNKKGF